MLDGNVQSLFRENASFKILQLKICRTEMLLCFAKMHPSKSFDLGCSETVSFKIRTYRTPKFRVGVSESENLTSRFA